MGHLPTVLLRELFNPLDNLVVRFRMPGLLFSSFFLAFAAFCGAEDGGGACEMATAEGRPLKYLLVREFVYGESW